MNKEEAIKILKELDKNANVENADMNDVFGGEHLEAMETVLKENFGMKTKLEKIQMLNLYIGSQDYDNEDNVIIEYAPFCLEDLEESD